MAARDGSEDDNEGDEMGGKAVSVGNALWGVSDTGAVRDESKNDDNGDETDEKDEKAVRVGNTTRGVSDTGAVEDRGDDNDDGDETDEEDADADVEVVFPVSATLSGRNDIMATRAVAAHKGDDVCGSL
jgi:hypothetical protein